MPIGDEILVYFLITLIIIRQHVMPIATCFWKYLFNLNLLFIFKLARLVQAGISIFFILFGPVFPFSPFSPFIYLFCCSNDQNLLFYLFAHLVQLIYLLVYRLAPLVKVIPLTSCLFLLGCCSIICLSYLCCPSADPSWSNEVSVRQHIFFWYFSVF